MAVAFATHIHGQNRKENTLTKLHYTYRLEKMLLCTEKPNHTKEDTAPCNPTPTGVDKPKGHSHGEMAPYSESTTAWKEIFRENPRPPHLSSHITRENP